MPSRRGKRRGKGKAHHKQHVATVKHHHDATVNHNQDDADGRVNQRREEVATVEQLMTILKWLRLNEKTLFDEMQLAIITCSETDSARLLALSSLIEEYTLAEEKFNKSMDTAERKVEEASKSGKTLAQEAKNAARKKNTTMEFAEDLRASWAEEREELRRKCRLAFLK